MSLRKQIISGSAWVLFGRASGALVGLAFYSMLTRLLPPADVGTYFLALSTATILATAASLGLQKTVIRLIAEARAGRIPRRIRGIVLRSVALTLTAGSVLSVFYLTHLGDWLATSVFSNPLLTSLHGYIAAWCILLALRQLLAESFRGLGNIKLASLFGGLISNCTTTALLAACMLIFHDIGIELATAFTLIGLLFGVSLAIFLISREIRAEQGDDWIVTKQILAISVPIMFTDIAQVILAQSNIWILSGISTENQVALYGTVMQLVLLISLPFIIINNAIPQMLVRFKVANHHDKLERLLQGVATAAFFPALFMLVGLLIFGRPLLELVYGEGYGEGANALIWLAFGQLVNVITGPCGIALTLTGHQKANMVVTTTTGFFAIPLALLLSARYGATGAAASAAIAIATQNIALAVLAKHKLGVRTHVSFSKRIMVQFVQRADT